MKLTFKVSCLELIEDIISLSMHRGLIDDLGLEAAEVCYRGSGSARSCLMVKECKLIAETGHRSGRSKRRYRVRKDGTLASKNSFIPVRLDGRHYSSFGHRPCELC